MFNTNYFHKIICGLLHFDTMQVVTVFLEEPCCHIYDVTEIWYIGRKGRTWPRRTRVLGIQVQENEQRQKFLNLK